MQASCIICSDLLGPTSEIYSTGCGHVFHHICLVQWIERSRTCPQCRCKVTEKTIHRLYFNVANTDPDTDVATLQSKMEGMQFQLLLKDKDIKNYTQKYGKAKNQNNLLRDEVKTLENQQRNHDSVIYALKEQINFFKQKGKDVDKLTEEIRRLKNQLKNSEDVQTIINGSREQVRDMMRFNKDPEALNLLVCTLKKELVESERRNKVQSMQKRQLENDLSNRSARISDMTANIIKLENQLEGQKNWEKEKQYYKKKLADLESKISSRKSLADSLDTSIQRIITESPAPLRSYSAQNLSSDKCEKTDSPSVEEKVQNIRKSDSCYLSIKSSNVGLSCLMSPKFKTNVITTRPPSQSTNLETFVTTKPDYSYNGLGGTSKELIFPKPVIGVKRSKTGSISSSKFRKLAPNRRMQDYLHDKSEDDK